MLETVRKNFEGYTKKQVENAILARKIQAMVAHTPDQKFKDMVSHKILSNCRVRVDDINNAHYQYFMKTFPTCVLKNINPLFYKEYKLMIP